jgi:hypothetical protein
MFLILLEMEEDVQILAKLEETFTDPAFLQEIESYLSEHLDEFSDE